MKVQDLLAVNVTTEFRLEESTTHYDHREGRQTFVISYLDDEKYEHHGYHKLPSSSGIPEEVMNADVLYVNAYNNELEVIYERVDA